MLQLSSVNRNSVASAHAQVFLGKMKTATVAYGNERGIPENQMAIFASISDNVGDFGGAKGVPSGGPPLQSAMER